MDVIGTIKFIDEPVGFPAVRIGADGSVSEVDDAIQAENLLDVYVNDILTMQLGCSASDLVDLVVGRLFTEGLVKSADQIDCLSICEQAMRADVYLVNREADLSRSAMRAVPTCCTNNRVLNDYFGDDDPPEPLEPAPWDPAWVFALAAEFEKDKTSHARTRGVHSAYLARERELLCVREDIGRHNAFDKVVGWAIANEVDLRECLLFTSGRVPTDMVMKAVRARIPLLATKAVATDKTVMIAREYGLSLVCEATSKSIDVLSGMERAQGLDAAVRDTLQSAQR